MNVAQVEDLLAAFLADVDAVATGIVALAERTDVLALGIENDDGVHRGSIESLMFDVNETIIINGDAVGRFPADVAGQLAPVVDAFVAIVALADDGVFAAALVASGEDGRGRTADQRRRAGHRRLLEEIASSHGRYSKRWNVGAVRNVRHGGAICNGGACQPPVSARHTQQTLSRSHAPAWERTLGDAPRRA
jgi:hypothetical protein